MSRFYLKVTGRSRESNQKGLGFRLDKLIPNDTI